MVKVVFQRTLAARSHENEFLDAGGACLVNGVLDQGTIDQRHYFLGHRLGCRQKSGS